MTAAYLPTTLLILTLLGLSAYGFPYNGMQQRSNMVNGQQQLQQSPPVEPLQPSGGFPQQQQSLPVEPIDSGMNNPQPSPLVGPSGTADSSMTNSQQSVEPIDSGMTDPQKSTPIDSSINDPQHPVEPVDPIDSSIPEPQQQTPSAESVEVTIFDPIDNETESTQVIVESLTEAERSHLISYFLCEMCKELQVSMCMRICNGETTDGSGSGAAEIEGSGAETGSNSAEGSGGQDSGDTIIIVVEGSGQESKDASGQEASNENGAEGSGIESSGFGESEASGEN